MGANVVRCSFVWHQAMQKEGMRVQLTIITTLAVFILMLGRGNGFSQGAFQNLGFESANLTPVPSGQYGGEVSTTAAIPHWTAFLGATQVTQILQNNETLGNA